MSPPGLTQTSLLFILINTNSSSSIHDVNRSILQNLTQEHKFLEIIIHENLGIWASTYASNLEPLYLLQKKAIRIITFSPPRTRSKPLFSKLNILSLHSLYKFHVSCFVFSHFNRLLPASLSSLLHFNRDFHDSLTRFSFQLV